MSFSGASTPHRPRSAGQCTLPQERRAATARMGADASHRGTAHCVLYPAGRVAAAAEQSARYTRKQGERLSECCVLMCCFAMVMHISMHGLMEYAVPCSTRVVGGALFKQPERCRPGCCCGFSASQIPAAAHVPAHQAHVKPKPRRAPCHAHLQCGCFCNECFKTLPDGTPVVSTSNSTTLPNGTVITANTPGGQGGVAPRRAC